MAWENIKENIKTSATASLGLRELKHIKPWFHEECLGFLEQGKQATMQWIPDPSQSNVDNLNHVRHDASRHFRNKTNDYLKAKIEGLETNSKLKNIRDLYRGISVFKKGYQSKTYIVKDEKGDLVADFTVFWQGRGTISLSYWIYMALKMLGRQNYRITHSRTTSAWANCLWGWVGYWKAKKTQSPCIDQIPTEFIKAWCRTNRSEIHKLIISVWDKEKLPQEW